LTESAAGPSAQWQAAQVPPSFAFLLSHHQRLSFSSFNELTIHHRVPLHIDDLPPGAVFKGYEDYIVQELVIESQNTLYLRARYQLPVGSSVLAPLPAT
jgi:hypothetical protein